MPGGGFLARLKLVTCDVCRVSCLEGEPKEPYQLVKQLVRRVGLA